jgi:hypothetical protein
MKNFASLSILASSISCLGACGGGGGGGVDAGPKVNPAILYLAPDASELQVKLAGTEPPPY